jgi:hypothetical protein
VKLPTRVFALLKRTTRIADGSQLPLWLNTCEVYIMTFRLRPVKRSGVYKVSLITLLLPPYPHSVVLSPQTKEMYT